MVSSIQSVGSIAAAYQSAALTGVSRQNKVSTTAQNPSSATSNDPVDFVTISTAAASAFRNDALLPTSANLQKSSARLTQDVNAALTQAGIGASPPISFSVDPNTAQVTVTSDRPDAKKIEDLINNNRSLKLEFHKVSAQASQLSVFQKGLKAVDAYQAANTPAQIDAVINQYYSGGPAKPGNITLTYDGTSIQADADGKPL
jgi:hypothetical protein